MPAIQAEGASLIVSGIVLLSAGSLAWREWRERRARVPSPAPEETRHYRLQDARRSLGVVLMVVLAAGVVYGSRLAPRGPSGPNKLFLLTWVVLTTLILGLVILAALDWIAVKIHARRIGRALRRERVEILSDEIRRRRAERGDGGGEVGDRG